MMKQVKASTVNQKHIVRSCAIIGDTHTGSDYAPWPEIPVYTRTGKNLSGAASRQQKKLARDFNNFIDITHEFGVDTVFHLGDIVQGTNRKESGAETVTSELEYQKDAAEVLIAPIVEDRQLHIVSGSGYHQSLDSKVHQDMAKRLGQYNCDAQYHGPVRNIALKGTDKVINIGHTPSSGSKYLGYIMEIEYREIKIGQAAGTIPKIDYVVRGHLHKYRHLDLPDMHLIQAPGWQAWYPLKGSSQGYARYQPDIGGIILMVDEWDRTIILHFLYDTPKIADFTVMS